MLPLAAAVHVVLVVVALSDKVQQFSLICPLQLSSIEFAQSSVAAGLTALLLSSQSLPLAAYPVGCVHATVVDATLP
jgi:hypothetical protein